MSCLYCFSVYHKYPRLYLEKPIFESIYLTSSHVRTFYLTFCQVDHAADVATAENLLTFFDVKNTMFSKRMLAATDDSVDVSFTDFVLSVWNYCSADADTLHDLCFRMYLPKVRVVWP